MASQPADPYPLTAAQFLAIDFPSEFRGELDDGVIRMMTGGTREHARVQMNLYRFFSVALRGSGCQPLGSDMAVKTGPRSVRYPDLTVDCGQQPDDARELGDPRIIVEVLSPTTRRDDEGVKLGEYQRLPMVDTIVLVDLAIERVRVLQRTGPDEWRDRRHVDPVDLELPALGITLPHAEIFARD